VIHRGPKTLSCFLLKNLAKDLVLKLFEIIYYFQLNSSQIQFVVLQTDRERNTGKIKIIVFQISGSVKT